jgi:hypothetical protein
MIKNNRNNEQIYGRNDMIMLDQNNKIYGSLGLADNYVMKTEEGTRLILNNPKLGKFGDVLTEFNMYGRSEQKQYSGKNLLKIRDGVQTERGVTITAKDGVVALKGTATGTGWVTFDVDSFVLDGTYILSSNITIMQVRVASKSYREVMKQNKPTTLENEEVSKVVFPVAEGKTYDISDILIQVEKGSEATSYEPYTGGIPSPSLDYPQEIKSVVSPTVKVTNEDGTQFETANLTYTLNAIPVASGGNVTIDGQQWICDEVDLERGVKVQRVKSVDISSLDKSFWIFRNDIDANVSATRYSNEAVIVDFRARAPAMSNILPAGVGNDVNTFRLVATPLYLYQFNLDSSKFPTVKSWVEYLEANTVLIIYALATPIETQLTPAEIAAFNVFTTYYPVTIVENNYNTWMKATYKSTESV